MKLQTLLFCAVLGSGLASAQRLDCDFKEYKPLDGLKADLKEDALHLTWQGERGQQLRAAFGVQDSQPVVRELAARKNGGAWVILGRNLSPEFNVTSGRRRLSEQQMAPLRGLKIALTPEVVEREKWKAFWDAPLQMPGTPGGAMDLPRKPEEIRRATATYRITGCKVKTDGA